MTNTGHVENRLFYLPPGVNASDIEKTINILNERLVNVPLEEFNDKIYTEVAALLRQHINNYDMMLHTIAETLKIPVTEKLFFGGKSNILSQPEFRDFGKIRMLMEIDGRKKKFMILSGKKRGKESVSESEGKIRFLPWKTACFITATYSSGADQYGTIAILGPTRMEYSRVISLLQFISNDLTTELTKLYQNN